nr:hypothetical protein [Rhizobium rhizogenes]
MAVLSDTMIMDYIKKGLLVPQGDTSRASECSYSCLPGRAFVAGSEDPPIDFADVARRDGIFVLPGQMIWIRTSDSVKLPNDIVAFWWQTNSLSRKGLMLVNMSMVEPGYEGDLACLFVNTGKARILLTPQTVVAKLVFSTVDGPVLKPFSYKMSRETYDAKLRELATDQPRTFLQVADLATQLQAKLVEAIESVDDTIAAAKEEIRNAAAEEKKTALEGFQNDTKSVVLKAFGWALLAMLLLGGVSYGIDFLSGKLDIKKTARSQAEDVVAEHLRIDGNLSDQEVKNLLKELAEQKARIDTLEKTK